MGTREEIISIDETIVDMGLKISTSQADFFVHEFSINDIRTALFDIEDDKSPGPDGYSSTFFKKAWNIVGTNSSSALMEFLRLVCCWNKLIMLLCP